MRILSVLMLRSLAECELIDHLGDVGIGTSAPAAKSVSGIGTSVAPTLR